MADCAFRHRQELSANQSVIRPTDTYARFAAGRTSAQTGVTT